MLHAFIPKSCIKSFENAKSDIPIRKHEGKYLKSDETER